ncbi:hypothetical protein DSO57_1020270 [Entomophthora muscae]|uniref:Uncharacterized protein n=1 Tax=Entomophthora muscae TaxID=34485 RepID=A0ACC2RID2_9FUNG|nr:hypothetical protein DSO57_1020270 [Entomophthora muscae]
MAYLHASQTSLCASYDASPPSYSNQLALWPANEAGSPSSSEPKHETSSKKTCCPLTSASSQKNLLSLGSTQGAHTHLYTRQTYKNLSETLLIPIVPLSSHGVTQEPLVELLILFLQI